MRTSYVNGPLLGRPGLWDALRPGPDVAGADSSLRRLGWGRVQLVPPREPRRGAGGVALPHVHHRDPLRTGCGCEEIFGTKSVDTVSKIQISHFLIS